MFLFLVRVVKNDILSKNGIFKKNIVTLNVCQNLALLVRLLCLKIQEGTKEKCLIFKMCKHPLCS